MKSDNYALKLNDTTVFVKGYSASVPMHVETPNAPFLQWSLPYRQRITPNYTFMNRLLWIPVKILVQY